MMTQCYMRLLSSWFSFNSIQCSNESVPTDNSGAVNDYGDEISSWVSSESFFKIKLR